MYMCNFTAQTLSYTTVSGLKRQFNY